MPVLADQPTPAQRLASLAGFAEALPDPCILIDRRSVVRHCNAAARREFPGLATGGLLTLALRSPILLGAIDEVRATGAARTVELHQPVPNETWYRAHVAPLADSAGELVLTLNDLTEARRTDRLRADFIANASHELRTPLTSLVGFIDTLLGPAAGDAAARERFLGIMRQQAARMSSLIDDLLSLSRIEMRQHQRPTGDVDLARLLREVSESFEVRAAGAGVQLALTAPDTALVTGDRDELYEVVENLIDNAIKYGGEGGLVEVTLGEGRDGFALALVVADHGPGIAPEHVPRLTERFYRVDAESSRRQKGTGLGLAIVKHIVSRHHGQLAIRSTPGQGTSVEVLLGRQA